MFVVIQLENSALKVFEILQDALQLLMLEIGNKLMENYIYPDKHEGKRVFPPLL